jgi:hypothetical protein
VVLDMPKGKSMELQGFNTIFLHVCWVIIMQDALEVVKYYRKFVNILLALNSTFLALIPKEDKVEYPRKF